MAIKRTSDGVVVIDFADLSNPNADLSESIAEAFGDGPNALGALYVSGVHDYMQKRERLLPLASKFASLPEELKAKTVNAESSYSFGWSHGKEKFDGKLDVAKGSYYANPQYDVPTEDPELIRKYPHLCMSNIWPGEECKDLADAFKDLGQLIVSVGSLLASHCDKYAAKALPEFSVQIQNSIAKSRTCKARLLHYFPQESLTSQVAGMPAQASSDYASWCGWHLDNSSLTGLTKAMYLDASHKEVSNPDPDAGLYIRNRGGNVVKVSIPTDCIAFQMGESTQIRTAGKLRATPHCVRGAMGPEAVGISRNTFAVFMQPHWDESLDPPAGYSEADVDVPQWKPGMTFADFLQAYFKFTY